MRYWVYRNGEVPGSYEPHELARMPDFGETSMVCPAEGETPERNWRRAGLFPDIVEALRAAPSPAPPPAPQAPMGRLAEEAIPKDPNEVLSSASSRIFRHVTELMKELENRREERALAQALQRQVADLKNELMALRERNAVLQERAELIPGFEEREKGAQEQIARMRREIQERDRRIADLAREGDALRSEIEKARRSEADLSADLQRQSHLAEDLSRQLAEKELALAKAFGVIRRLESMLGGILPESGTAEAPAAPPDAIGPEDGEKRNGPAAPPPPAPPEAPSADEEPPAAPPWKATLQRVKGLMKGAPPPEESSH